MARNPVSIFLLLRFSVLNPRQHCSKKRKDNIPITLIYDIEKSNRQSEIQRQLKWKPLFAQSLRITFRVTGSNGT